MTAGRPTKYQETYPEQARKLCLLGATDPELADFFDVCTTTIDNWRAEYPEFLGAIKSGKIQADAHIADRLYSRAEGAEWEEQQAIKVKTGPHTEQIVTVTVRRAAPPDSTAIIFWLKNRRSAQWRDRQEYTVDTDNLHRVVSDVPITNEDWASKYSDGAAPVIIPSDDAA